MYVLIVGGGRTGSQLAKLLYQQDHVVHLVDDRKEVLSRLHRELPTEMIHEGRPMDPQVLERANLQKADVLAATPTSDDLNLVLC